MNLCFRSLTIETGPTSHRLTIEFMGWFRWRAWSWHRRGYGGKPELNLGVLRFRWY